MFHKAPEQEELNKKIKNLQNEYLKMKGDNINRLKLIKLIQSVGDSKEEKYPYEAALGSCVYGLIQIGQGYDLFSGEKTKNRFNFFRSELATLLQDCLNISYENSLGEQRAFIYLTNFYHYIKAHPCGFEGEMEEISKTMQKLLEDLAKKRPTYQALINNFTHLPEKYRELGGSNAKRDQYAQFLSILNEDLKEKKTDQEDKEWSEAYTIRFGAMLFMMEKIESGYNLGALVPVTGGLFNKGSQLYKTCKSAMNINVNTKEISDTLKRKYYIDFLSHILRITLRPKELEKWVKKYGFKDAQFFFENLQNNLAERLVELIKGTKQNARPIQYMDLLASTAASYGVTIAIGKIAKKVSFSGSVFAAFKMLRPEAALLITLLAYSANAFVTYKATDTVNRMIIDSVSQPVVMTFSNIEKFGEFCLKMFYVERGQKTKELVDNEEFLEALNSLPSHILTNDLQEKMHRVAALEYHSKGVELEKKTEKILSFPLKM